MLSARPARPVACQATVFRSELLDLAEWRCNGKDMVADELNDAYQVIVVRFGAFLGRLNGRERFLSAGMASSWHPGDVYRVTHPTATPDRCSVFTFAAAAFESPCASDDSTRGGCERRAPAVHGTLDGGAYLQHRRALDAARRTVVPVAVEEATFSFLARAVSRTDDAAPLKPGTGRAREYAERVRMVIGERYREPLSLAEISRAVACSPYHLSRLVRAVEGRSIHRMIVQLRLTESLEWLLDTREDISRIAYHLGFSSHSHFTAAFRRAYGCAPSALRSQNRQPAGIR